MTSIEQQVVQGIDPAQRREARRRVIVRWVFFIFILSLLEGPLRKWFFPSLSAPLTLLRDPFVIALYFYAFTKGFMLRRGLPGLWFAFCAFTVVFGALQYTINEQGMVGLVLGLRTYWLYMPMAFVIAASFREEDLMRFLRMNMWIAIPYAFLISAQYSSPPYSFLNLGVGADDSGAVELGMGIVRPFGLFTYTGPNVQYTAFVLAGLFALLLGPPSERPPKLLFIAMAIAIGVMSVLTGSRSIYFLAAAIAGFTLFGSTLTSGSARSLRFSLVLISFGLMGWMLITQLFPDMLQAMEARFERAANSEGGVWVRASTFVLKPLEALTETATILGGGIGAGAPGVARFIGLPPLIYGESDLQRNLNELGMVVGVLFVCLRLLTVYWIALVALNVAKRGMPLVLPIAAIPILQIAVNQITHSPLSAYQPWLCVGFVLAMRREQISQTWSTRP